MGGAGVKFFKLFTLNNSQIVVHECHYNLTSLQGLSQFAPSHSELLYRHRKPRSTFRRHL